MLAAWGKMKYPHIFDGTIAASAPILAFTGDEKESSRLANSESYWAVVSKDATKEYGSVSDCARNVRTMFYLIDFYAKE